MTLDVLRTCGWR